MPVRVLTASLAVFFGAYGIGAGMVSAGTVSAGNQQPGQSTAGGGGAAKPQTDQGTITTGRIDAMPDKSDPNFDPSTDYYAIIAWNSTDDAYFEDYNQLIAEAQGFSADDVEWRGAFSGELKCYVKTINAPQNPDHGPYSTLAEATINVSISPEPLPSGGSPNSGNKHDSVSISNNASGSLSVPVAFEFTQPDPSDPNITLPYRSSSSAGTSNKVKFRYSISGAVDLVANRPEVEVGAYVHTISVSASLTAWDPSSGAVINQADGTPGVWTMN